jgi:cell division protein FtsW (lipid II flippase)
LHHPGATFSPVSKLKKKEMNVKAFLVFISFSTLTLGLVEIYKLKIKKEEKKDEKNNYFHHYHFVVYLYDCFNRRNRQEEF